MQQASTAAPAASKHYSVGDALREWQRIVPRDQFLYDTYRVQRVAKRFGQPPTKIELDVGQLRKSIAQVDPTKLDVAWHSFEKELSAFCFVIENSSFLDPGYCGRSGPLPPEWKEALARAETPHKRGTLSRLAHYCARRGIAPAGVDGNIYAAFVKHWQAVQLLEHHPVPSRKLARIWDELAVKQPDLRLTPLGAPMSRGALKYISYDQLPGSLRHEVNHFLAKRQDQGIFSDFPSTRPIGSTSAALIKRRIHRAVDALVRAGEPIGNIKSLADITSVDAVRRILQICHNDKARKPNHENWHLASLLRQLAKLWARRNSDELKALKKLQGRLRQPKSMGKNYADLLEQFDEPEALRRLVDAPAAIWERVRAETRLSGHTLARAQAALAIDIELNAAATLGPLAGISFADHLDLDASTATGSLILGPDETPSGDGLRLPLPRGLVQRLLEYRDEIFPAIAGRKPTHVFLHRDGRLKTKGQVRTLIQQGALRHADVRVTPQMFRYLAGLLILRRGGKIRDVARVLGIKDLKVLERLFGDILRDLDMQEYADGLATREHPDTQER